jgi:hypothetical protein
MLNLLKKLMREGMRKPRSRNLRLEENFSDREKGIEKAVGT